MKKYVCMLTIWLIVAGGNELAANPPVWNRGELILSNGTVLEGELNYNWKAEIVRYRQGDVVKAYSAQQVKSFKYFDDQQNNLRKFVTVNFPIKPTQRRPILVEEVTSGPLMVYRRLRHPREFFKIGRMLAHETDKEMVKSFDNFDYFVVNGDTFTNLNEFNHLLWPQMREDFNGMLQHYYSRRSLNLDSTVCRLMLINQYNYLKIQDASSVGDVISSGE